MDRSAPSTPAGEAPAPAGSGGDHSTGHLHIGQVAARTELSLRTIRHYDEVGLVRPSARSQGGFRLYTEADVARLMVIRRMKPLGFTLAEMGELLAITDRLDDPGAAAELETAEREQFLAKLSWFEQATRERCEALRTQLSRAEEFATDLRRHADRLTAGPT
ncbi:MerR family transcriptional regulator [Nonomuraea sp. NPDC050478]|uniref:MerR family transcriptional regulator n=1 Tax=unclassified Nonomuraea TaxID=2593643 RepID=UPI0011CE07FA|nr:MerR family transcriptional regulator [Nonomuraea sp. C10]TXK40960.1 MerR family transcriptional regulator [Nonomuraea sp. C10]